MLLYKLLFAVFASGRLLVGDTVLAWTTIFKRRISNGGRRVVAFPVEMDDNTIHEHFMKIALQEARYAAKSNEVPIGAVVVRNITEETNSSASHLDRHNGKQQRQQHVFQILSTGRNKVEGEWDASAHAELVALRQAARRLKNWRLLNCTLYSTVEPCPMCLSACQAFRLGRLVCGAPDLRLGAVGTHMRLLDVVHPFHNVSVTQMGVLKDDCADIMRSFFRARRQTGNAVDAGRKLPKWFGHVCRRQRN